MGLVLWCLVARSVDVQSSAVENLISYVRIVVVAVVVCLSFGSGSNRKCFLICPPVGAEERMMPGSIAT